MMRLPAPPPPPPALPELPPPLPPLPPAAVMVPLFVRVLPDRKMDPPPPPPPPPPQLAELLAPPPPPPPASVHSAVPKIPPGQNICGNARMEPDAALGADGAVPPAPPV